ncbi:hypothetical protein FGIG_11158, partial [Fasciola gigantica]
MQQEELQSVTGTRQIADANTQTETEYKPSIKKYEVASQVEFVQKRYDVEAQSGIVSQVGSTQTVEEIKSIPIDTTIQSEQQIQVDVVAPVRALKPETPKDDFAVQAYLVPTKYDVEAPIAVSFI